VNSSHQWWVAKSNQKIAVSRNFFFAATAAAAEAAAGAAAVQAQVHCCAQQTRLFSGESASS